MPNGGNDLVTDAVNGAHQLVSHATDNLGLGDIAGDPAGGVIDGLGNGLVGDAVADTQSLGSHIVR